MRLAGWGWPEERFRVSVECGQLAPPHGTFGTVLVRASWVSLGFQRVRENSGSECPRLLGLWECVCPVVRKGV